MIYILYGEMGCGKSYWGRKLAFALSCDFVEGDSLLPHYLKDKVDNSKLLTKEEVQEFYTNVVSPYLFNLRLHSEREKKDFVFSQALYSRKGRMLIKARLGNQVRFIRVHAPLLRHLSQLKSRNLRWIFNALVSRPWFQPGPDDYVLENWTDFGKIVNAEC